VFPPAVLPVLVARCGVGSVWLVGRAWGSPLLGGLPLLFFPFLLVGLRPWRSVFPRLLWWAVVFRALLGCWSRQVVLSPFLGCVCVLPFPFFNYIIVLWKIKSFFWFFFCSVLLLVGQTKVFYCSLRSPPPTTPNQAALALAKT
jgi:hypothetical protein